MVATSNGSESSFFKIDQCSRPSENTGTAVEKAMNKSSDEFALTAPVRASQYRALGQSFQLIGQERCVGGNV
jgi:hypothetical protein